MPLVSNAILNRCSFVATSGQFPGRNAHFSRKFLRGGSLNRGWSGKPHVHLDLLQDRLSARISAFVTLCALASDSPSEKQSGPPALETLQQDGNEPHKTTKRSSGPQSASNEQKRGDPYGKKVLGKEVTDWLAVSMSEYAAYIVKEVQAGRLKSGKSIELLKQVEPYLSKHPAPPGCDDKAALARGHVPTLWEALQREAKALLQNIKEKQVLLVPDAKQGETTWKNSLVWRVIKEIPTTESFAVAAKASQVGKLESSAEVQKRVDEFVAAAKCLLQVERDREVSIVVENFESCGCKPLPGALPKDGTSNPGPSRMALAAAAFMIEEKEKEMVGLDRDRNDALAGMVAVSSRPGLSGNTLMTLRRADRGPLPPSSFQPGDVAILRVDPEVPAPDEAALLPTIPCSVYEAPAGQSLTVALSRGDLAESGGMLGVNGLLQGLFGVTLRLDRLRSLANEVTYERNIDALETLAVNGVTKSNCRKVVKVLFGDPAALAPPPVATGADRGKGGNAGVESTGKKAGRGRSKKQQQQEGEGSSSGQTGEGSVGSRLAQVRAARETMDKFQLQAVDHAVDPNRPVVIIKGPPGTGKTTVVSQIVAELVASGQRVLAAAPSNAAVDNMVDKFSSRGLKVVRLGNPTRMSASISQYTLSQQVDDQLESMRATFRRQRAAVRDSLRAYGGTPADKRKKMKALERQINGLLAKAEKDAVTKLMAEAEVVLCTNTGAGDAIIQTQPPFDVVVVDEAAQATEPSTWIPLIRGRRAILAGDDCQLAPTVIARDAVQGGLNRSLMERAVSLYSGALVTTLQMQYRMCISIAAWSSQEMYQGQLLTAPAARGRTLATSRDVQRTRATRSPMLFIDLRRRGGALLEGCEEMVDPDGTGSLYNRGEAELVVQHVAELMAAGLKPDAIAVQSPYNAQVLLLRQELAALPGGEAIEVASVDSFQGRQADAVVISMVRSNDRGAVGFLADSRRMNVAITRARKHVAVVGDSATLSQHPFLNRLLLHIKENGEIRPGNEMFEQAPHEAGGAGLPAGAHAGVPATDGAERLDQEQAPSLIPAAAAT